MKLLNLFKAKVKTEELSIALAYIVARFIVEGFETESEEEKREVLYFLLYQIDVMLFSLNPNRRNEIFDAFSKNLFLPLLKEGASSEDKIEALNTLFESYNTRVTIYSNCNSLIGEKGGFPGKGSAIFALGYFLKSASGKTEIPLEDLVGVLGGRGDVDGSNIEAFSGMIESIDLTVKISSIIIEIKKFLNESNI